ncbi:MAG: ammonia-forming cytochrome c nitrite reductase subunit c552 [Acidobacteriota bacterium]
MSWTAPRVALPLAGLLLIACGGGSSSSDDPAPTEGAVETTQVTTAQHVGSASCAECHAEVVESYARSAHALASRPVAHASLPSRDTGLSSNQWTTDPHSLALTDASGESRVVPITHALGGQRRQDYLGESDGQQQVLPWSWSATRETFVDPVTEERGEVVPPGSGLFWTEAGRNHDRACSRCHPIDAEDEAHGLGCETCHGPAGDHVAAAREGRAADAPLGVADDAWSGCAHCHAVGRELPRRESAHPWTEPFHDLIIANTLVSALGRDLAFDLSGRPILPHGYEVQALATSACAQRGGVTCLTCHDPHGGASGSSLREADPDASCRSCHAEIVAQGSAHTHHPMPDGPVPLASVEPHGPDPSRAPGCVDCHLPASLVFSPGDLVRDHAIANPEPSMGEPDACLTCHANQSASDLSHALDQWFPDRERKRRRLSEAFSTGATAVSDRSSNEDALRRLLDILLDDGRDSWTRANAVALMGAMTVADETVHRSLLDAAASEDPTLALAASTALGRTCTTTPLPNHLRERLTTLAQEHDDWRVRLSLASTLHACGDDVGLGLIESLQDDPVVPASGRAAVTLELGKAHLVRGTGARASFWLEETTRLNPDLVDAWLHLGLARQALGDLDGAQAAWEEVLVLRPGNVLATSFLGAIRARTAAAAAAAEGDAP